MIDLTPILEAAILLVFAVVVYRVWPYLTARYGDDTMQRALFWVQIAVSAAEQIIKGTKAGADRKAWVKNFLNNMGFDADLDWLDAMIESEVEKLNSGKQ